MLLLEVGVGVGVGDHESSRYAGAGWFHASDAVAVAVAFGRPLLGTAAAAVGGGGAVGGGTGGGGAAAAAAAGGGGAAGGAGGSSASLDSENWKGLLGWTPVVAPPMPAHGPSTYWVVANRGEHYIGCESALACPGFGEVETLGLLRCWYRYHLEFLRFSAQSSSFCPRQH